MPKEFNGRACILIRLKRAYGAASATCQTHPGTVVLKPSEPLRQAARNLTRAQRTINRALARYYLSKDGHDDDKETSSVSAERSNCSEDHQALMLQSIRQNTAANERNAAALEDLASLFRTFLDSTATSHNASESLPDAVFPPSAAHCANLNQNNMFNHRKQPSINLIDFEVVETNDAASSSLESLSEM
nr:hypothetical protein CFP56_52186 [Quercus suber]